MHNKNENVSIEITQYSNVIMKKKKKEREKDK